MNVTKIAVLTTIGAIIKKYKGNWSFASQKRMLELLKQIHTIPIKRRQLCYHLADLRAARLITTIKRHRRDENGQICLMSSATALTVGGCVLLFRLGNRWALKQLEFLKSRYGQESTPSRIAEKNHKPPGAREIDLGTGRFQDPGFRVGIGLPAFPPCKT